MTIYRPPAVGLQKRKQTASMVVVAVGDDNRLHIGQIFPQAPGIGKQSRALTGIEQER